MLRIDKDAYESLQARAEADFIERAQQYLAQVFSRPVPRALVARMAEKGRGEDIASERGLVKYMMVLMAANPGDPMQDPAWIAEAMNIWGDEDLRVRTLCSAASQYAPAPSGTGTSQ